MESIAQLWTQHQQAVWIVGLGSLLMLVASAITVPIIVVRLPADFYKQNDAPQKKFLGQHIVLRWSFLVAKNLLGGVLLVAGILMLFLPGQGILTILIALAMLNFPGKRTLEIRILRTPAVLKTINWLRRRAGRGPLVF